MVLALKGSLFLYGMALISSIAAMEIISVSLTLLAMALFLINKDWKRLEFTSLGLCLLFFNLAIFLSLLLSPSESVDWVLGLKTFKYSMWCWALSYLLVRFLRPKDIKAWLPYWVILVSILSLYTIFQFFFGIDFFRSESKIVMIGSFYRPTGFFSMSLTLAYSLAMGAISLVPLAYYKRQSPYASIYWAAAFIAMLAVGLSLSRGAWISYTVALLVVLAILRSRPLVLASLSSLVIVGLVLALNPSVQDKFWNVFNPEDSSQSYRWVLWKSYWQIFLDHPILGTGWLQGESFLPQAFKQIGEPDFKFFSHSHSNYLQVLSGTGVVGILAYLALLVSGLRLAWRNYFDQKEKKIIEYVSLSLLGSQVLFHVGGMTESNLIDAELTHFLFSQWAILLAFSKWLK